jgi:hypothetical protein
MHSFSIDLNESKPLNQVPASSQVPMMNRFQRKLLKRSQNIRTSANGQVGNTTTAELLARRWRENTRRSRPWMMLGLSASSLLAACATVQVASDYDRSANFSTYHTFTLMQRQHRGILNPLVTTRAEDDISQELQRRGYTPATDSANADFTVDFSIGSQDRISINSYPVAYAGPFWGSNLDVHQYREGTLAIDVFDAHTHRPVWHGWAKKELSSKDIEQPTEPISKAVSSVLAKFPPA